MTTSFQAPTGDTGGATGPTSFQAPGVAATSTTATDDKTVVFEHGGRKFTAADLAKKIDNADGFIETLKAEQAETRTLLARATEALGKTLTAADVLAQIRAGGAVPPTSTPAVAPAADIAPKAVTAEEVAALVLKQQGTAQQAQVQDANWQSVTTALTTAFGTKTDDLVKARAAENGLSLEAAASLARTAPKAFLALFPELKAPAPANLATRSSVNSLALAAQTSGSKGSSGYASAKGTKATVTSYLNRLKELGF